MVEMMPDKCGKASMKQRHSEVAKQNIVTASPGSHLHTVLHTILATMSLYSIIRICIKIVIVK